MSLLPVLLLALPAAAPPVEDVPAGVLVVRSLDELKAAANHLAGPLGYKKEVETLNSVLALPGLDRTRPAGVFVRWPAYREWLDPNEVVAFAAIRDEKQFLASCRLLGARVSAVGERYRIEGPGEVELFLRFAGGHVYASEKSDALRSLPAPGWLAFPPGETGLLVARGWPSRAWGLEKTLEQSAREVMRLLPPELFGVEPDKRAEGIKDLPSTTAIGLASGLREEIRELNLRVELDRKTEDLSFQFSIVPNPGTPLARGCRSLRRARGRFTRMFPDTSIAVQVVFPPPVRPGPSRGGFLEAWSQAVAAYLPPRYRGPLLQLTQTLGADLAQNGLNAAVLVYPDESWLAALEVRQGRKLDGQLRDLYRAASTSDRKAVKVRFNQERIGTARVHRIGPDEEAILLALRDDLVVAGQVGTPVRKQFEALLLGKMPPDEEGGPFVRLEARGSYFSGDEKLRQLLAREAPGTDPASLYARLHLEGGSSLTLKVRLHTQALRALSQDLPDE
jgi:hypothetical protein